MTKGSCLCGAIEYEVDEIAGKVGNCHCSICRKSHGAAFATQQLVKGETFILLKGSSQLKEYESSSGVLRAFCSNCGSRLMNYTTDKTIYMSVALSSIDSEFKGKPSINLCVASKAEWFEIKDGLPCFDDFPKELLK